MMSTQSNLDSQKELNQFLTMISPSLRIEVQQKIFLSAIHSNEIFSDNQSIIEFVIADIKTLLYLPEDDIVIQGANGTNLFFIARGECEVWVKDHERNKK